ncbi:MAG: MarR family transcriptional regulator [Melioribacteraceae bacterium]|jgi:MarR family 2-MHQ and catechol resistance regulon transcriptional repressor|nr:MarR family transcriptional regulator [Melioribacteraceae bacterium]
MSDNMKNNLSIEVWRELTNTFEHMEKSHARRMAHLNLTNSQYSVLRALSEGGTMPLKSISQKLNVTGANITCVMDNLQKRNYAERIPSKLDRRIINAELTKEGKQIIKKFTPLYIDSISEETKNLTDDEKKSLVELLAKLKN